MHKIDIYFIAATAMVKLKKDMIAAFFLHGPLNILQFIEKPNLFDFNQESGKNTPN